jgi:hypothetical protein
MRVIVEFKVDRKMPIVRDMGLDLSELTPEYLGFAGSVLSSAHLGLNYRTH